MTRESIVTLLPDAVRMAGPLPVVGRLRLPGDKSVSHRALLLGAMAEGTSTIRGLSEGADVASTEAAVRALGTDVHRHAGTLEVEGGSSRWHPAAGAIDCGNSGTSMRLLAGVLAGCPWSSVLTGDESLSRRPMDRVAEPLEAMGAKVSGRGPRALPPVTVAGGRLHGVDWTATVASAQVKSAILLAGVQADGTTIVRERVPTRAHTEEMLRMAGADIEVAPWESGRAVTVRRSSLRPLDLDVPGDPSQAAFWIVAGAIVAGSEVTVTNLYPGAERVGFLGVLQRMGAPLVRREDEEGGSLSVTVSPGALEGTVVDASEIPSLDEVPVLAVAAAAATGTTDFVSMGELRVKETDRLAAVAQLVSAFGARAEVRGDDLRVHGTGGALVGASIDSGGDHRMAMAAAVAALAARGPTFIEGFACVATSYPGFLRDLTELAGEAWEPVEIGAAAEEMGLAGSPAAPPGEVPRLVIAVDGPAGAGKSTVSAAISQRLGIPRLDTGAMYRAVTWLALERGIDPDDRPAVAEIARTAKLDVGPVVRIDGVDVTEEIRTPRINQAVSHVAANPEVRAGLVAVQRRWVEQHPGAVVEGRDIGSVVFPDAAVKVYLTADPKERAQRRIEEGHDGVERRDRFDSSRADSPLTVAPGAHVIDTTDRSVDEVVEEILSWLTDGASS